MLGWHYGLNGHEFEKVLGDGEGQGSLACCSTWSCKESDMTQGLNSTSTEVGKWGWQVGGTRLLFELMEMF